MFLCGSVVGAFHKVLMEKTLRQTFQDTLRCLSMKMKLEIEKRQQVCATLLYFFRNRYEIRNPIVCEITLDVLLTTLNLSSFNFIHYVKEARAEL